MNKSPKQQISILDELKSALPSITVALPTQGSFYRDGVLAPGTDPANVVINPSTVLDEVAFRNPYKAISGTALSEMLKRVCPTVLDADLLCLTDVEAILLATRLASHGPTMELTMTCDNEETVPSEDPAVPPKLKCGIRTEIKVDLKRALGKYLPMGSSERWALEMPNGHKVQTRPITYHGMKRATEFAIEQARLDRDLKSVNSDDEKEKLQSLIIEKTLRLEVETIIDGVAWILNNDKEVIDDRMVIRQWLAMAPTDWVHKVKDRITEVNKAVSEYGLHKFPCPGCGREQLVTIASDPSLFFSSGSGEPPAWMKPTR